jgi:hypothetical protein
MRKIEDAYNEVIDNQLNENLMDVFSSRLAQGAKTVVTLPNLISQITKRIKYAYQLFKNQNNQKAMDGMNATSDEISKINTGLKSEKINTYLNDVSITITEEFKLVGIKLEDPNKFRDELFRFIKSRLDNIDDLRKTWNDDTNQIQSNPNKIVNRNQGRQNLK